MNYLNEIQTHHNDKILEAMRFSTFNNSTHSANINNYCNTRSDAILSDRTCKSLFFFD
jgi:hypothetical protein